MVLRGAGATHTPVLFFRITALLSGSQTQVADILESLT